MNLGKEELSHRIRITVPLLEQIAILSAKKKATRRNFRREIEDRNEDLQLEREFSL